MPSYNNLPQDDQPAAAPSSRLFPIPATPSTGVFFTARVNGSSMCRSAAVTNPEPQTTPTPSMKPEVVAKTVRTRKTTVLDEHQVQELADCFCAFAKGKKRKTFDVLFQTQRKRENQQV